MQVNVKIKEKCPGCEGTGYNNSEYFTSAVEFACNKCKGVGHIHVRKYIDLDSFIKIIKGKTNGRKNRT